MSTASKARREPSESSRVCKHQIVRGERSKLIYVSGRAGIRGTCCQQHYAAIRGTTYQNSATQRSKHKRYAPNPAEKCKNGPKEDLN
jgi:hypothetical protein